MLRYNLLFIHVASAMAIFAAFGMEALALAQLRRATVDAGARSALAGLASTQRISGPASLALLLSGVWLASAYWQWQGAWMGLGFVTLIAIGAIGGAVTGRGIKGLHKNLETDTIDNALTESISKLQTSFAVRGALLVAAVYLMTVKPSPFVSFAVLATAVVIGVLLSRTMSRPETRQATRATT